MAEQTKKRFIVQLVVAAVLIAGGYIAFVQARVSKHINYTAYFDNIRGLQPSSPVQINGVRVGKISDIVLEGERLKITIAVNKDVALPEGTKVSLASGGLTGDKIIVLTPGQGKTMLGENAILASGIDTNVLPLPVRLKPMIETAKTILNGSEIGITGFTYLIHGGLATQSLDMLIAAEKQAAELARMTGTIDKKTGDFSGPLHKANVATTEMASNTAKTSASISELEKSSEKTAAEPLHEHVAKLRSNISELGKTFHELGAAGSALNKALTDKEAYKKTSASLDTTNGKLKKLYHAAQD